MLTLEEKKIPYNVKFIDLDNKPEWMTTVNPEGKVPIMKYNDEWIPDSGGICDYLEEKFPEPSLKPPSEEASNAGSKVSLSFLSRLLVYAFCFWVILPIMK